MKKKRSPRGYRDTNYIKEAERAHKKFQKLLALSSSQLAHIIMDNVDEQLAIRDWTYRRLGIAAGYEKIGSQASWWSGLKRRIHRGEYTPQWRTVCRLATALGLSIGQLLEPFGEDK